MEEVFGVSLSLIVRGILDQIVLGQLPNQGQLFVDQLIPLTGLVILGGLVLQIYIIDHDNGLFIVYFAFDPVQREDAEIVQYPLPKPLVAVVIVHGNPQERLVAVVVVFVYLVEA